MLFYFVSILISEKSLKILELLLALFPYRSTLSVSIVYASFGLREYMGLR
jgi:ABC-type Na+ efflux pump permease subunit